MTELERALLELDVAWPATPDLAAAVSTRIAAEVAGGDALGEPGRLDGLRRRATRARRGGGRRLGTARGWRPRLAAAAVAVLVLGGGTLAVSPEARSTVRRWLGLGSVEIRRGPVPTPRPRPPAGAALRLGRPVSLAAARRAANLPVRAPAAVGAPDAVYLGTLPDGQPSVSLVYAPRPGLKRSDVTGVAMLVQVFRARVTPFIQKTIGAATKVEHVSVAGARGYWIEGANGFAYESHGAIDYETQRVADTTLLVERRGVLIRVEGTMSRALSMAIAATILDAGR